MSKETISDKVNQHRVPLLYIKTARPYIRVVGTRFAPKIIILPENNTV